MTAAAATRDKPKPRVLAAVPMAGATAGLIGHILVGASRDHANRATREHRSQLPASAIRVEHVDGLGICLVVYDAKVDDSISSTPARRLTTAEGPSPADIARLHLRAEPDPERTLQ